MSRGNLRGRVDRKGKLTLIKVISSQKPDLGSINGSAAKVLNIHEELSSDPHPHEKPGMVAYRHGGVHL